LHRLPRKADQGLSIKNKHNSDQNQLRSIIESRTLWSIGTGNMHRRIAMTKLSAAEVCRRFKVNKTRISRALSSGEILGEQNPNRPGWLIDIAEAKRWVRTLPKAEDQSAHSPGMSEATVALRVLEGQILLLRELLEEAKQDRDRWRELAVREMQSSEH
jgi:hypothetical protein